MDTGAARATAKADCGVCQTDADVANAAGDTCPPVTARITDTAHGRVAQGIGHRERDRNGQRAAFGSVYTLPFVTLHRPVLLHLQVRLQSPTTAQSAARLMSQRHR